MHVNVVPGVRPDTRAGFYSHLTTTTRSLTAAAQPPKKKRLDYCILPIINASVYVRCSIIITSLFSSSSALPFAL